MIIFLIYIIFLRLINRGWNVLIVFDKRTNQEDFDSINLNFN